MTGGLWKTPASELLSALREQAEGGGDPSVSLSDLDLLNGAYDAVLGEWIDTRDRYMSLLTSLRGHDDRVRAGAVSGFRPQIDRIARHVVREHLSPHQHLLYRIEHLPDSPSPEQIASLKSSAATVRYTLRKDGPAEERLDPGDARHALKTLRSVIAALQDREGVTAEDALRLMSNALHDGPPLDLLDVGTPRPRPLPPDPEFAGPGWTRTAKTWTYQPAPDSGFVKAYPLGEDWYMDLWSAHGHLVAYGTAHEGDVAALAPALIEQAETWSNDRSEYAWRRFANTREALRAGPPTSAEDQRVRAATTSSPGRSPTRAAPTSTPPASPAAPAPSPRRR